MSDTKTKESNLIKYIAVALSYLGIFWLCTMAFLEDINGDGIWIFIFAICYFIVQIHAVNIKDDNKFWPSIFFKSSLIGLWLQRIKLENKRRIKELESEND
jgi:hypothetical protein